MSFTRPQWLVALTGALLLVVFGAVYFVQHNYEFVAYHIEMLVTFAILALVIGTAAVRARFSTPLLWGFTLWGFLHMLAGCWYIGGERLYDTVVIPLSTSLPIIRFDQIVHVFGLFILTIGFYRLRLPWWRRLDARGVVALGLLMVIIAFGHEFMEWLLTVILPNTGIGDIQNETLDLLSDALGTAIALGYLWFKEGRKERMS